MYDSTKFFWEDPKKLYAYVRILGVVCILAIITEYWPRTTSGVLLYPTVGGMFSFYSESFSFLVSSAIASAAHVWVGILVGSVIGFSIGTLVTVNGVFAIELGILLRLGLAYPRFAFLSFFLLWFRYTEMTVSIAVTVSVVLITAFQSMLAVQAVQEGGKDKNRDMKDVMQIYFNSDIDRLVKQVWPETRPQRYAALKYCAVMLFPTLVLAEAVARPNAPGLGALMWRIRIDGLDPDAMFGTAIVMMLCAGLSSVIIGFFERYTRLF